MTREQAIIIAKILYDDESLVRSDYTFEYQPYDPSWYEDAREYVRLIWEGVTFGETVDTLIMEIDNNFNVYFFYSRKDGLHNLGVGNQHKIHRQLIKWNCEPANIPKEELRNDNLGLLGI